MILWRLPQGIRVPPREPGDIYTDGQWHTKGHYCTYLRGSASIVVLEKAVSIQL
jgi:hypothetical protein